MRFIVLKWAQGMFHLLMIGLRATSLFRSTSYEFLMTSFIARIREKRGRGVLLVSLASWCQ